MQDGRRNASNKNTVDFEVTNFNPQVRQENRARGFSCAKKDLISLGLFTVYPLDSNPEMNILIPVSEMPEIGCFHSQKFFDN